MALLLMLAAALAVAIWLGFELWRAYRGLPRPRYREPEPLDPTTPGTSSRVPIVVPSASVIEPRAEGRSCRRCGERTHIAEHRAGQDEHGDHRLVEVRCSHCGFEEQLYFRIETKH